MTNLTECICANCGEPIKDTFGGPACGTVCSHDCMMEYMSLPEADISDKLGYTCYVCGTEVFDNNDSEAIFTPGYVLCSNKCYGELVGVLIE